MSGPRAWRANKASRKKLNLKASKDKLRTSTGKTFKETRQIDNIYPENPKLSLDWPQLILAH